MKRRETKRVPSADLLVCFPPKAHLALLPKPICSPARPAESSKRHPNNNHRNYHHPLKKSTTRRHSFGSGIGGGGGGRGRAASPLLWAKNKQMAGTEIAEPTSPKVTCAGQIKVRHKAAACKSWQSVMEEIERIHNSRKNKKKSSWMDSFGFKKDVMQFLTCLRNIKFDFRCFGAIPQTDIITSDDDEEDDDDDGEDDEFQEISNHGRNNVVDQGSSSDHEDPRTFSKWFMVLQEDQNNELKNKEINCDDHDQSDEAVPVVPPPNALLLMRCRSAPAKTWLKEKQLQEEMQKLEDEEEEEIKKEEKKGKNLKALMEEEKVNSNSSNLVVINYDTDFYKISTEIAKETWVVGGMKDPLSRSRSWKR